MGLLARGVDWRRRLCAAALALQIVLVSSYFVMEHRYLLDFVPFLVFGYALWLERAGAGSDAPSTGRSGPFSDPRIAALALAVAVAVPASTSAALSAISIGGPGLSPKYKNTWAARFAWVDRWTGARSANRAGAGKLRRGATPWDPRLNR